MPTKLQVFQSPGPPLLQLLLLVTAGDILLSKQNRHVSLRALIPSEIQIALMGTLV